jgi:hypothetical protein
VNSQCGGKALFRISCSTEKALLIAILFLTVDPPGLPDALVGIYFSLW